MPATGENTVRPDRWLVAAAVVVGIASGNHSLTLLLGPPILLYVFAVDRSVFRRPRLLATCAAAVVVPAVLVRFEMVLRAGWFRAPFVYTDTSTWDGFWYVTLGKQFHDWLTNPLADWGPRMDALATIASRELGPLTPLVLVAFAVTTIRVPRYALLTGTTMLITCFFNSIFPDGAIDRYYIGPALIAWTWLAVLAQTAADLGTGTADEFLARHRVGSRFGLSPGALRVVALAAVGILLILPSLGAFSDRASRVDQTRNVAAQAWADAVFGQLEPHAIVVSWWSYSTTLWYEHIVDGRRPDIQILDDRTRLDLNLGELDRVMSIYVPKAPVYVIRNGPAELDELSKTYNLTPVSPAAGNVYRVTPKSAASR